MALPVTPLLTVDCVAVDRDGRVLMIKRAHPPFKGRFALPGGFVDVGETVEDACRRELYEETGMRVKKLTLIGVYSAPKRDPRRHAVSVAFLARLRSAQPKAGDDAAAALWVKPSRGMTMAFDHANIWADAKRLLTRSR